jgi:hypothetical protein
MLFRGMYQDTAVEYQGMRYGEDAINQLSDGL